MNVPQSIRNSLLRYTQEGIPTGDFLRCILSNDLLGAVQRGDDGNLDALVDIVLYVYIELPSICWGSPERVDAWIYAKHIERELEPAEAFTAHHPID